VFLGYNDYLKNAGIYREDNYTGSTVAGIFSVTVTVILPVKV